jgi:branched-chain amino acid transport system ATP-binding protein
MSSMLRLEGADVFYGSAQALHQITLELDSGEIVGLVGRNGAGKSTVLKALMGLLPCRAGRRTLAGAPITAMSAHLCSRMGIAYVPEDRQVFPNLTVEENLAVAQVRRRPGPFDTDKVFALFPNLQERLRTKGQALSGGEQQMLSIARALVTNPSFLLLDEPTEGLAPLIVQALIQAIIDINTAGIGIVLVEQNFKIPLRVAHRFYVIDNGELVWIGDKAALIRDKSAVERLISV